MKTTERWFKEKLDSFREDPEFRLERIILDLTEEICVAMERKKISRAMLAEVLNVSPAYMTKCLRGSTNFTLKTLLAFGDALDLDFQAKFDDKGDKGGLCEIHGENVVGVTAQAQGRTEAYTESPIFQKIFTKPPFDAASVDLEEAA
jgi:ribosome-binding protein aMBF1 (putative translation factor)